MEFYERLQQTREDRDLSQSDIASILKTTKQQISKYETGYQTMTVPKLKTLCLALNVSADYLLGLPRGLEWPR